MILLSIFKRDFLKLASNYYQSQDYNKALKYALKAINSDTDNIDKIMLLGNICYVLQDYEKAQDYYCKILLLDSHNIGAQINYADTLIMLHRYSQAEQYLPNIADEKTKLFLQAKISFAQEDFVSAEEYFIAYTKLKNTDAWAWNMLSQSAQKNGHFQLALEAGITAVEKSAGDDSHHLNLAYTIYEIAVEKGKEFVLPILQKWYAEYPDNPIVKHSWNCFFPSLDFCKSDSLYVKKIFDEFADSFDETLQDLDYTVPLNISQIAKANMQDSVLKKISILDLGCGTGLCAQNLKKIFNKAKFFGVDISPKMLAKAQNKNIYKKLINDDIESYLFEQKNKHELIVAADVLTYFGDLKTLFQGMYKSLKENGKIIFSVSALSEEDLNWQQHLSGRFLHSKKYIKKILIETGFCSIKFASCMLRKEGEKNVFGWIVYAVK